MAPWGVESGFGNGGLMLCVNFGGILYNEKLVEKYEFCLGDLENSIKMGKIRICCVRGTAVSVFFESSVSVMI